MFLSVDVSLMYGVKCAGTPYVIENQQKDKKNKRHSGRLLTMRNA
ncbi:hypothetical protein SAMN05428981_102169 [Bacillus sp. OV194]|nr:hypothetical protein SAMN05428981_102169 [Bacillus sp. OV194]